MEEDRKREKRVKAERMAELKKMADEMFEVAMKNMREEKGDQVVPQNNPACACADHIQEREWMFEKLKVHKLPLKVEKAEEELKPIRDKKEGARKRRTSKPHIR
jgi:hypothetical protein